MSVEIIQGDCRTVMAGMDLGSVDAIVTDPPYELGFMGKSWDKGGVANCPEVWGQALRVLKPGGHLLAFGGTRTYHRMVCAIEDAGFEIRDMIAWLYGSGFPKSKNHLKPAHEPICLARKPGKGGLNIEACRVPTVEAWAASGKLTGGDSLACYGDGLNNAGRSESHPLGRWPANVIHDGSDEVEAAFAAFGPTKSTGGGRKNGDKFGGGYAPPGKDVIGHGDVGSVSRYFMACKHSEEELLFSRANATMQAWNNVLANTAHNASTLSNQLAVSALSDAATLALPEGRQLSDVTGLSTSVTPSELRRISESVITAILSLGSELLPASPLTRRIPNGCHVSVAADQEPTGTTKIIVGHWKSAGCAAPVTFSITPQNSEHGARGLNGSDRFRYCAKASKADRDDGLSELPERLCGMMEDDTYPIKTGSGNLRETRRRNHHPTVKPTALMRYLCRLITPPGGLILDPFAGSGSTGRGAVLEGFRFIGIEMDAGYCEIARLRIAAAAPEADLLSLMAAE